MKKIVSGTMAVLIAGVSALVSAQSMNYGGSNPENFGAVNAGTSVPRTRTVSSPGGATFNTLSVTGAGFGLGPGGTCTSSTVLGPGGSCTVTFSFAPGGGGLFNGNLNINCTPIGPPGGITITCGPGISIGLLGTGLAAVLAVVPALDPALLTALAMTLLCAALWTLRRRNDR